MFAKPNEENYVELVDGITIKTLVHGEATLMSEFRLEKGSALPKHSHPYEQTGYLLSGRLSLTVGAETRALGPGASWCIPADVEHAAEVLEDARAVEVFAPAREDYLKFLDTDALF